MLSRVQARLQRELNAQHIRIGEAATERDEAIDPVCEANDNGFLQSLAEFGAGIVLLPAYTAARAVHRDRLAPVLQAWSMSSGKLSLLWPASRHLAPRVRTFVDLACERLSGEDWL